MRICSETENGSTCGEVSLDGGGSLDLCDPSMYDAYGWEHYGQDDQDPKHQCFWNLRGGEPAPWRLTRRHGVELHDRTSLVFSWRSSLDLSAHKIEGRVLVSTNEFKDCTTDGSNPDCRVVATFPYDLSTLSLDLRSTRGDDPPAFRTMILDVSDFDKRSDVKARFEIQVADGNTPWLELYDIHFVSWR